MRPTLEPAMTKAESAGTGLRSILIATAVAGGLSYAIQLLAPALLADSTSYVTFSVFWSTLYLCVAALSGVQQEITRAARPVQNEPPTAVLQQFTLIAIATVLIVVSVLALLVGHLILPGSTVVLVCALGIGVVGYLLVAVLSGVLYGLRLWSAVAWLTVIDVAVRAVLVIAILAAGGSPELVAIAISIPFGLAFLVVWLRMRSTVTGAFRLDVKLPRLLAHVAGTVIAAASMGLIMNGLPLLLGLTSHGSERATLAGLILAVTLTRAPIVVPLLALQSYLISIFRGGGPRMLRQIIFALGFTIAGVLILAVLAWLLGPWAIALLSGGRFEIEPVMMAFITVGAGLVALMCITGPALISQRRHAPYVAGWVIAALLTVGALILPLELPVRLSLALVVPPTVGVLVHLAALLRSAAELPAKQALP